MGKGSCQRAPGVATLDTALFVFAVALFDVGADDGNAH